MQTETANDACAIMQDFTAPYGSAAEHPLEIYQATGLG